MSFVKRNGYATLDKKEDTCKYAENFGMYYRLITDWKEI